MFLLLQLNNPFLTIDGLFDFEDHNIFNYNIIMLQELKLD